MNISVDIHKICRTCCEEGSLISLYSINYHMRLSDMLIQCTNLKITETDGLPPFICSNCVYRLEYAYKFKVQCENADLRLRAFLGIDSLHLDPPTHSYNIRDKISEGKNNYGMPELSVPAISDSSTQVKDEEIYAAMNVVCNFLVDTPNTQIHQHHQTVTHPSNQENSELTEQVLAEMNELIINHKQTTNEQSSQSQNCEKVDKTDKSIKKTRANLDNLLEQHKRVQKEEKSKKPKSKGGTLPRNILKVPEQCLECGKVFHYFGYLEAHQRTHTGERPYECQVCQKKFAQSGNLSLHMRVHTGERPFQCEICPKRFTTSGNLTAHQKTHTDIRDFVCKLCSRAFRSTFELKSHEGTHTGVKNHLCKVCGKAFYKTSYLNNHLRTVHIGEKRHRCAECGKEFANSSNLTCHYRIHTGEKPYTCEFCDTKFNQSSALVRHKKQHEIATV